VRGVPGVPGHRRPSVFYLYEIYADTDAFRVHLATDHVAYFFTELARHSTTDASALVQLVELHAPGRTGEAGADAYPASHA
jgi:quinol monooxygenase YgiN